MTKTVSIILCLLMIVSVVPVIGLTASAEKSGYYTYSVSNGEATITDCDTSISGNITIPSELGIYPVTSIGNYAFSGCSSDLTIYGYANTKAEEYANNNNIKFFDLTNHTHSYTAEITKEPTCTEKGVKTFTCSCGDSYTEDIPATGIHSFVDGKCEWCGEIQSTDILYGDINGDGKVNSIDRTFLSRHIAKWEGYEAENINIKAADLNRDGKVNSLDRTILSRYIAKWNGYEDLPYKK